MNSGASLSAFVLRASRDEKMCNLIKRRQQTPQKWKLSLMLSLIHDKFNILLMSRKELKETRKIWRASMFSQTWFSKWENMHFEMRKTGYTCLKDGCSDSTAKKLPKLFWSPGNHWRRASCLCDLGQASNIFDVWAKQIGMPKQKRYPKCKQKYDCSTLEEVSSFTQINRFFWNSTKWSSEASLHPYWHE